MSDDDRCYKENEAGKRDRECQWWWHMSIFNKMFRKASPDWNTSAGPEKRARARE